MVRKKNGGGKKKNTVILKQQKKAKRNKSSRKVSNYEEQKTKIIMKKATMAKVVLVFPTRNEETTIKACIEKVKKSKYKPIIIVSDGHSSDKTIEIAKKCNTTVVMPQERLHPGKGAAMIAGIKAALQKNPDVIIFLDADIMNLTTEWIDLLVDSLMVEGYDMSRGWYPLSGEIAAKKDVWKKLLHMNPPDGWGIDVWLLIETAMAGFKIREVFLGTKTHRSYISYSTDVSKLAKMGQQVGMAIIQEALKYQRIDNAMQTKV